MATVYQKRALTVNLNERVNTVTLSCEEYEQLLHRPGAPSTTPSYSGAFIASHGESWVIDSDATSHLTGNRSYFLTFSTSPKFSPVRLADGSYFPISGSGTVQPTTYLTTPMCSLPPSSLLIYYLICKHGGRLVPVMSVVVYTFSIQLHLLMLVPFLPRSPLFSGILVLKSVSDFCNSKGLHQTSCPYTSQQNGVAERKHRHILDVARTIMTHMHVPKSYWGDAVLTACYLINRMPSTVLNGDTPYSCLFPDKPLFGITPRVFGCVFFVHIHSPSLDKLSPCSVKCIFLGYSRTQKGYRCYDPQSRRSFTSADVTFFEFTPFYSPQSSVVIPPPSVPLPVPTLSVPLHIELPTRPLQVYSRRNRSTNTTLIVPPDLPPTAAPGNPSATPANDLHIALRKGKRSCTAHPLAKSLSFQNLSLNYRAFSVSLSSVSIPNTYCEVL
ncbi:Retrovirus-related Pol polyprotein from transposon TNT 1-94 [Sesamum angolense]|uniref:Retrovirus-related Pol polyprotein from transposon TNT 1-94 n=1 Tax=Sesamum angolense TaxID=2727404 RepID=A0AAE1X0X7_9LAMI|nr:Retrovirus-related Pol polyprotein from transposon TNT 1-94 [Sesamum angolense]